VFETDIRTWKCHGIFRVNNWTFPAFCNGYSAAERQEITRRQKSAYFFPHRRYSVSAQSKYSSGELHENKNTSNRRFVCMEDHNLLPHKLCY